MTGNKHHYASRCVDRFLLLPAGAKLWRLLGIYLIVLATVATGILWREQAGGNTLCGLTELINGMHSGPTFSKDLVNAELLKKHAFTTVSLIVLSVCGGIGWSFFTAFLMAMHNRREANVQNGASRYAPDWKRHGIILGWGPMGVSAVKKLRAEYECCEIVILSLVNAGIIRGEIKAALGIIGQDVPNWLYVYNGHSEAPEHLDDLALESAAILLYLGEPSTEETLHDSRALSALTQVAQRTRARSTPLPCHLCILSVGLFNLLASKDLPEPDAKGVEFHPFSPYANWARRLWSLIPAPGMRHYPSLAYRPLANDSTIHLFVIGFGSMGRALAIHAIKIAHYPGAAGLRVTVVDPAVDTLSDDFRASIPFDLLAPLRITFDFIKAKAEAPEVRKRLVDALADTRQLVTVAVCIPVPDTALETAIQLPREVMDSDTPVLLRQSTPLSPGGSIFSTTLFSDLYVFGSTDDCGLDKSIARLAQSAHEIYLERTKASGLFNPDKKASHRPWSRIPAIKRLSNINQTDAVRERLAAWGYAIEPSVGAADPIRPEDIESIADAEHRRWWAEYILSGWRWGPTENAEKRTHPSMIPFSQLDKDTKEYDRSVARSMPELLHKEHGVCIRKKA